MTTLDKVPTNVAVNPTPSNEDEYKAGSANSGVDKAWEFLNDNRDTGAAEAIDINVLRRKIDWRIVPLMFLCYTMQFLDKVILNVRQPSNAFFELVWSH